MTDDADDEKRDDARGGRSMLFDVYFNEKRDLVVVIKGSQLPPVMSARKWRKSPKKAIKVSDEIKAAVAKQGYYVRRTADLRRRAD